MKDETYYVVREDAPGLRFRKGDGWTEHLRCASSYYTPEGAAINRDWAQTRHGSRCHVLKVTVRERSGAFEITARPVDV